MDSRCLNGGILKLRELIEEHPSELAYDFRSRFGLSVYEIGNGVTWLEAILLVAVLLRDPTSWIQAAVNDWDFPVSREWIVQAHTYDLLHAVNSKNKPKPYPTPWVPEGTQKLGSKKQTRSNVLDKLERMNPKESDG